MVCNKRAIAIRCPSMKVPPKRKGNPGGPPGRLEGRALNESPSEKEGKSVSFSIKTLLHISLNESPSEKEGKCYSRPASLGQYRPLNESPSEKEGKSRGNH